MDVYQEAVCYLESQHVPGEPRRLCVLSLSFSRKKRKESNLENVLIYLFSLLKIRYLFKIVIFWCKSVKTASFKDLFVNINVYTFNGGRGADRGTYLIFLHTSTTCYVLCVFGCS